MKESHNNQLKKTILEGKLMRRFDIAIYRKLKKGHLHVASKIYRLLYKPCRFLDRAMAKTAKIIIAKTTRINPNTIMFLTFQGDFTCNPKGIAEEIIRQNLPVKLFWVVNQSNAQERYPRELTLIQKGSYEFYRAAASAKILIDNTHNLLRLGVHKKRGQILMQTWHGSLGIKRLDGQVVMGLRWKKTARKSRRITDFCISNSTFETEVFHSSYWKDVPILLCGHARNDLFFGSAAALQTIRGKVFQKLGLPEGTKVLLYAPTHRDGKESNLFQPDYIKIRDSLRKRFGGDWVVLVRLHSRLRKLAANEYAKTPDFVKDVTDYEDIQELMVATDAALTDYSSWIFDYLLLKRPGFIIANDLDNFGDNRSFYYPIESTPFPIARTNEQLCQAILDFDEDEYQEKTDAFLAERGCMEDGMAAKRIVDKMKEILHV